MNVLFVFLIALACVNAETPKPLGDVECTICTTIVGFVEDYVGSNATLADIETFLNTTVCGLLPSFLRPECAALVDEYAPVIAQKIFQGYPASVVCKDIGLCSSRKKVSPKPLGGAGCTICTLIVGYAEDYLESNSTLAEIEIFLNTTVCGLLPSFLQGECATLMDTYAPRIAKSIEQHNPPSTVCQSIGLCSSRAPVMASAKAFKKLNFNTVVKTTPFKALVAPVAPLFKTQSGAGCTICTVVIGYAEDYLGSNSTQAEIEVFLNSTVCGLLPSILTAECAALVDEYEPLLVQKILKQDPASTICSDIGLCSSRRRKQLFQKLVPAAMTQKAARR